MKVILFGATGMVGQGVLRECLLDPEVTDVLTVGRTPTGVVDRKLREIVHADPGDLSPVEPELAGYNACFYCVGTTSSGKTEDEYRRITYDLTMVAARAVLKRNPGMVMVFVSGAGTDSTEKGGTMWARIKGKAENDLLAMPFKGAYMFRPGYIQPMHGTESKTRSYRILYKILAPLYPVWRRLFPNMVTTTEHLGRAMLQLAKHGSDEHIFESRDIEALGTSVPAPPIS
jgi:uncharacterized protein YbjT (DUF2867 family)